MMKTAATRLPPPSRAGIHRSHMRILIIRHAVAEERESFAKSAQDDALRPLTRQGRKKMRKAARGLARLVPAVDVIASSPLVRAVQTAEIVSEAFDGARFVQIAALSPRKPPAQLLEWLQAHPPEATVALVGHEPHLSTFLCWLLTGLQESFVVFKKGAATLVEAAHPVTAGRAKMLWLLKSSQLREIK
jgi:phosphohistidine phosphatase